LIEFFVVPGVTVFGIGGGLLIIVSLVLAVQTFVIPQNAYQVAQLRNSLFNVAAALLAVGLGAMFLNRYLPKTPVLNKMVLAPNEAEQKEIALRETLVDWNHLVGMEGEAITVIRPSGKARFGDEVVDVITRGEPVDLGASLEVVEVMGNRVIVKARF
jgi:membrane-bound serine protease (ClpP class)